MGNIRTFEDLEAWKACRELRPFVLKKTIPELPKEEKLELVRQIRSASRSTTANSAEGYGRFHHLDNAKFCSNSRGSCWETLEHLISANDDEYIDEDLVNEGRRLVNHAVKLINGYMNYLKRAAATKKVQEPQDIAYLPDN